MPDLVFLEFIPYTGEEKNPLEEKHAPTVLLSEVQEGRMYEVVISQLYGMPLLRYRLRDIVKFVRLEDKQTGIKIPSFEFQRRAGETIDLAGLARLDEKTIWKAISSAGIQCADWAACKEYENNNGYLRIYIEPSTKRQASELETMISEQLKVIDTDFKDIDYYLKSNPVRVTLLASGTFKQCVQEKKSEGADIAHMKPNRINPLQIDKERLIKINQELEPK